MGRPGVLFAVLLAGSSCISTSGCKGNSANNAQTLHYAFSPQAEQLQGGTLRRELLVRYLSSELHMPVQVVMVEGYGPTVEAMRVNKVDVATLGPLSYLIAAQKANAEAIVSTGTTDGAIGAYYSVIAVPKGSPYHSLEDLKAHAKDITFSFADPASTSGDLYPHVGLKRAGIDPDKDFKKVLYSSHLASLMAVKASKVDAGGFSEMILTRMKRDNKIKPDDIRVIWRSDPIPNSPIAVRKSLPDDLKKRIRQALLDMPQRDPTLWQNIATTYRMSSAGLKYIPVTDHTYDGLRDYAAQMKDFNFAEK
jgi:phosphonate transport system substrate-binding protein